MKAGVYSQALRASEKISCLKQILSMPTVVLNNLPNFLKSWHKYYMDKDFYLNYQWLSKILVSFTRIRKELINLFVKYKWNAFFELYLTV